MTASSRIVAAVLLVTALAQAQAPLGQSGSALAKGKLLVARESLFDPNFARTVVLLIDYGETGASGVVLNRPSPFEVDHILPDLEWSSQVKEPVYIGGPVAVTRALMLYSTDREHEGSQHVFGAVHAGWDVALLESLVTKPLPNEKFRIYAGHAGWAAGQLEAEVERLGWYVFPATLSEVFTADEDGLWRSFIKRTRTRIAQHEPVLEHSAERTGGR